MFTVKLKFIMSRFFIVLFIVLLFIGCNKTEKKEYFVQPIEVVCDYPFNDMTKWAITCRVWGLLKYYHPNVTAGNMDWDKVLLDRMEHINNAKTAERVNIELMNMIKSAGKYKGIVDKKWNDSLNINVNLCWLDKSFINDSIRMELKKIASLKVMQPSYYVGKRYIGDFRSDGLEIKNEKDYERINIIMYYNYRLLALFRYWNVIYYFFPYKYLMDISWDKTLEDFIPKFIEADNINKYNEIVLNMSTRLNDGHSFLNISPVSNTNPKITVSIDTLTLVRIPPQQSLLKRGDIILSINEKRIKILRDSLESIIASSNQNYLNSRINSLIDKTIIEGCTMTVLRNQQELEIIENKKSLLYPKDNIPFYFISTEVGYVNLDLVDESEVIEMFNLFKDTKGIIFDLRCYPKQWGISCHLSSSHRYYYGQANISDLSHCGSFYIKKCEMFFSKDKFEDCKKYNGKFIVLINSESMSAAETMAIDFRIHGAILIGTPSAGANGNIAYIKIPGDIVASFSSLGFYYPNGELTQRKGIIPDIIVYPTMESIIEGKDEILEEAIRYINNLK